MKTHTVTTTREEVIADGEVDPNGANEMWFENVSVNDAQYTLKGSAQVVPLAVGDVERKEGEGNGPGQILASIYTITFTGAGDKKVLVTRVFRTALTV